MNRALTVLAALMVTTQLPVPVHPPSQPAKVEPAFAAAVRVTTVPEANLCVQEDPHEIPKGLLLTVPPPVPALTTVRSLGVTNRAITARAAVIER